MKKADDVKNQPIILLPRCETQMQARSLGTDKGKKNPKRKKRPLDRPKTQSKAVQRHPEISDNARQNLKQQHSGSKIGEAARQVIMADTTGYE